MISRLIAMALVGSVSFLGHAAVAEDQSDIATSQVLNSLGVDHSEKQFQVMRHNILEETLLENQSLMNDDNMTSFGHVGMFINPAKQVRTEAEIRQEYARVTAQNFDLLAANEELLKENEFRRQELEELIAENQAHRTRLTQVLHQQKTRPDRWNLLTTFEWGGLSGTYDNKEACLLAAQTISADGAAYCSSTRTGETITFRSGEEMAR